MKKKLLPLLVLLSTLASCSIGEVYVEADRETYDAVVPDYLRYLEADPTLSADQVDRRVRTVEAWRLRIEAASK